MPKDPLNFNLPIDTDSSPLVSAAKVMQLKTSGTCPSKKKKNEGNTATVNK